MGVMTIKSAIYLDKLETIRIDSVLAEPGLDIQIIVEMVSQRG